MPGQTRMNKTVGVASVIAAMLLLGAAPAHAGPGNPADMGLSDIYRCQSDAMLGLNPSVRLLCDSPMEMTDDGTTEAWVRYRTFTHIGGYRSSCGGVYYEGGCNWHDARDYNPTAVSQRERYIVYADAIPDGEPGHIE